MFGSFLRTGLCILSAVLVSVLMLACGQSPQPSNSASAPGADSTGGGSSASAPAGTSDASGTAPKPAQDQPTGDVIKDGTYTIKAFDKCMDLAVKEGGVSSRRLQLFGCGPNGKGNQSFTFTFVKDLAAYSVKSDGEYLQLFGEQTANDTPVESVDKYEPKREAQHWWLVPLKGQAYLIRNLKGSVCIGTSDTSGGDRVKIQVLPCEQNDRRQRWQIIKQ